MCIYVCPKAKNSKAPDKVSTQLERVFGDLNQEKPTKKWKTDLLETACVFGHLTDSCRHIHQKA